jgi:hypothetical protein
MPAEIDDVLSDEKPAMEDSQAMTQRERIKYARDTGHRYPLRTSSQTDPHFADQHERIACEPET